MTGLIEMCFALYGEDACPSDLVREHLVECMTPYASDVGPEFGLNAVQRDAVVGFVGDNIDLVILRMQSHGTQVLQYEPDRILQDVSDDPATSPSTFLRHGLVDCIGTM